MLNIWKELTIQEKYISRSFDDTLLKDVLQSLSEELSSEVESDNYNAAITKALFYKFYTKVLAMVIRLID